MEWKLTDQSTDQLIRSVWVTASVASELLVWAQFAGFPWNSWSNADTLRWNHCWRSEVNVHNNHNNHTLETGCFVTILQSGGCADPAGSFEWSIRIQGCPVDQIGWSEACGEEGEWSDGPGMGYVMREQHIALRELWQSWGLAYKRPVFVQRSSNNFQHSQLIQQLLSHILLRLYVALLQP